MSIPSQHLDVLKEAINMGIGQASGVLNSLLKSHVSLSVPELELFESDSIQLKDKVDDMIITATDLEFKGPLEGSAILVFPPDSATKLVNIVTDDLHGASIDAIRMSTLSEIGNIVLSSIMGTFGNLIGEQLTYSIPSYKEVAFDKLFDRVITQKPHIVVLAHAEFYIHNHCIEGDIVLILNTQIATVSKLITIALDLKK